MGDSKMQDSSMELAKIIYVRTVEPGAVELMSKVFSHCFTLNDREIPNLNESNLTLLKRSTMYPDRSVYQFKIDGKEYIVKVMPKEYKEFAQAMNSLGRSLPKESILFVPTHYGLVRYMNASGIYLLANIIEEVVGYSASEFDRISGDSQELDKFKTNIRDIINYQLRVYFFPSIPKLFMDLNMDNFIVIPNPGVQFEDLGVDEATNIPNFKIAIIDQDNSTVKQWTPYGNKPDS